MEPWPNSEKMVTFTKIAEHLNPGSSPNQYLTWCHQNVGQVFLCSTLYNHIPFYGGDQIIVWGWE